jgi:hypothetical protein
MPSGITPPAHRRLARFVDAGDQTAAVRAYVDSLA